MIGRRIEELYGYGAGRIALRSEPIRVGDPKRALRRGLATLVGDLGDAEYRGSLVRGGASIAGLALLSLLALALLPENREHAAIDLVPFEVAEEIAEEIAEVVPEPPPVVVPEPLPEPAPIPAPPIKLEPKRQPAPPVARKEPPPRREPPVPKPKPKPQLMMDAVAQAPAPPPPLPAPTRVARAAPRREAAQRAIAPLAAAPAPEFEDAPAPPRAAFRIASVAPSSTTATTRAVRVDPMPARSDDVPRDDVRLQNVRQASARLPERGRAPLRPELAPAAAQLELPAAEAASHARTERVAPAAQPSHDRSAAVDVDLAPLARATAVSASHADARPVRTARLDAVAAPANAAGRAKPDDRLSGVPLGSLAACRSDAEEDALKQQVVAAVTTQKECLSGAGHYRFLQTKNVNSFLMFVERGASRAEADRCVELRHAIDCLKRTTRTGARST